MNFAMPLVRLAIVAFAASFTTPFLSADAMAAKEKFERNKPHVNIGTIGHVDNGKSSQSNTGQSGATSLQSNNPGGQDCVQDPSSAEGQPNTAC